MGRAGVVLARVRAHVPVALLTLLFGSALLLQTTVPTGSIVPVAWPAAGLLTAIAVVTDSQRRATTVAVGALLLLLSQMLVSQTPVVALGLTTATLLGSLATLRRLRRGLGREQPGLVEEGDVSRLISAVAQGGLVSAVVAAGTAALAPGEASVGLTAIAVFWTHAAAQLILLPLCLQGPPFGTLAPHRERVVQSLIVLGATAGIFAWSAAPPLVFAIMPMFGWLAFRGTLREASWLLTGVAVIAATATAAGVGPVAALVERYALSPELVTAFLQLFLVDCALILLPLSVMATQQQLATSRATSREHTIQRLVDAATGTAVLAIDLDGRLEVFNPGAAGMFGRRAEEVLGQTADLLFDDLELVRHSVDLGTRPLFVEICAAASTPGQERLHWQVMTAAGTSADLLMAITPVPGDAGGRAGYLCVAEDVTQRETTHRALVAALDHERSAVDRLHELERIKSDFVAAISHELRTPLTSMNGYMEMLGDGEVGELSAEQRMLVSRVQRNGRRLLLLVEDLLLLSRIEAREMRMSLQPVDAAAAARAAMTSLQPLLEGRHLDLVVRLPESPTMHRADPDQIERLLISLLTNAVKFTPDGGRIELRVTARADDLDFVVADTGMGIPTEEQSQLFTRFFRSSTATEQAIQGAGMGLTIVQAIVHAHGGEIDVDSREGAGTTVTVTLPISPCTGELPASERTRRTAHAQVARNGATQGQPPATPYSRSPASPSPGTM